MDYHHARRGAMCRLGDTLYSFSFFFFAKYTRSFMKGVTDMMTDQEYKELKERLAKEGLLVKKKTIKGQSKLKQMHFLERAYKHFRDRQEILYKISKDREWDDWTKHNLCLISYGWDNIRNLVCWAYGVNVIQDLPDDKQDEVNDLAIKIIDIVFDQYSKLWEE